MKEFSIPLKKDYQRPVIELYNLSTLIDTGAIIPVFSMEVSNIKKYFDIKLVLQDGIIGGFDGFVKGSVYSIKNFQVGELIFNDFEVFVPVKPTLQFSFLLSATLFYGMSYEVDNINEKFTVRMKDEQNLERDFKIKSLNNKLYPQIDGVLIQDTDIFLRDVWIF